MREPKAGMRSAKPANRLEKPGFLREFGTELFLSSYVLYVLQALWNLSERIGLAKARGLSKEGMCHFSRCILYTYRVGLNVADGRETLISAYKFSRLVCILYLKELVRRIWLKIKAFALR